MKLEPVYIERQNLKCEASKPNLSIFKEIGMEDKFDISSYGV